MKIDGDLLKINGQKVIGLKAYRIGSNLLWKDAERNMNGDVRASYLGEYPKIELEFIDGLTQTEITQIYAESGQLFESSDGCAAVRGYGERVGAAV